MTSLLLANVKPLCLICRYYPNNTVQLLTTIYTLFLDFSIRLKKGRRRTPKQTTLSTLKYFAWSNGSITISYHVCYAASITAHPHTVRINCVGIQHSPNSSWTTHTTRYTAIYFAFIYNFNIIITSNGKCYT